ncbi:MAG: hypothetical protein WCO13_06085 [Bacteroidota bacterium]
MKKYRVIKVSTFWTPVSLAKKVEETLNEMLKDGYEIVTVSFTNKRFRIPVAYITACR